MPGNILLYPTLNDALKARIRYNTKPFVIFYSDDEGEEYELDYESAGTAPSVYFIKDKEGLWDQNTHNICFRRRYCLRTFQCLFGPQGIVSHDAKLGLAIQWTSADSRQRGVFKLCEFGSDDSIVEGEAEKRFFKAQLRGEVNFKTILYLAYPGKRTKEEEQFAETVGDILGELDTVTFILDGNGSIFPVYEMNDPGQPLWYISCDWDDPTKDKFFDCVSIILNRSHKSFSYIDRNQPNLFDRQLLSEIMASAITLIIEKVRLDQGYWDSIIQGDDLEQGSIGAVIYYFSSTLEWDLSTAETVSLSARKFFDQRM